MKSSVSLLLSLINCVLILGLAYYMWNQEDKAIQVGASIDQSVNKSEIIADQLAKLRLEFESRSTSFASDIQQQKSQLKKLSIADPNQLAELDASLSALQIKVEKFGQLASEAERLNALANQFNRLEALVNSLESELQSSGDFETAVVDLNVSESRLSELEQASIVLLERALIK